MLISSTNDWMRQTHATGRIQWEDAEWFDWGDTPTFVNATTITIPTDVTSRYQVGRRLKATDSTDTTIIALGTITSSSYASPNTTVAIQLDPGYGGFTAGMGNVYLGVPSVLTSALGVVSPPAGTVFDENPIINGACAVSQRGIGVGTAPNRTFCVDRFKYEKSATLTAAHNTHQGTGPSTMLLYAATLSLTTPQATIAAGDYAMITYAVEGYDALAITQRQITLSFWAQSTLAGTYSVSLRNGGSDRSCVATFVHPGGGVFTKFALTFPASPSAGTWNTTNGIGLLIGWCAACGTTFQTSSLGVWQTGNLIAANTQSNGLVTGNTYFGITGVRIDPGPVAAPFRYRTFAEELARCQRYYEKTYDYASAPGSATANAVDVWAGNQPAAVGTITMNSRFKVRKRTAPTVVIYDAAGNVGKVSYSPTGNNQAGTAANIGEAGFQVSSDATTSKVGMYYHWTADAGL
jgi:hypothetical protein